MTSSCTETANKSKFGVIARTETCPRCEVSTKEGNLTWPGGEWSVLSLAGVGEMQTKGAKREALRKRD